MSDRAGSTPKHIWIVGGLSLLWNSMGVMDYVATRLKLMPLPAAQQAYIEAFPLWASAGWALGVWGALLGSVLLLLKSRHAALSFGVSLAGLIVNLFWRFGLSGVDEAAVMGGNPYPFAAVIFVIALALFLYTRKQAAAGVLR
ncbi:MAG: hypothetical protein RLZ59_642 [Pseudomonadota bacterium]|jgi:hypothetical protein